MNVVVVAGLKNGRYICEFLKKSSDVNLIKVFVMDDKHSSKISDFVFFDDIVDEDKLTKIDRINDYEVEIGELKPDYIVVVGWSQIISDRIIRSANKACIGFHPSKLPKDRGRSVLAWQIAEGYSRGCVTMFEIDVGVDTGGIIGQIEYAIEYEDTIKEVLGKAYDSCLSLMEKCFVPYTEGQILPTKQNEEVASSRRLRIYNDGIINWNKSSRDIYNLVRAITCPYPMAVTFINKTEVFVVKAFETECAERSANAPYGKVISTGENGIVVKAMNNAVLITKIKVEDKILEANEISDLVHLNDMFTMEIS